MKVLEDKTPLVIEVNTIFKCIKLFPKETLCGRHGLRVQNLLDALCGKVSDVSRYLLCVITLVVNL